MVAAGDSFQLGVVQSKFRHNCHRIQKVQLSSMLYLDEPFSRWYGVEGSHLYVSLSFYLELDRKPDSRCKSQNNSDYETEIMLQMHLFKSINDPEPPIGATLNHEPNIALSLSVPWTGTRQHVCADSFFALFEWCKALYLAVLQFTGVVEAATSPLLVSYLPFYLFQAVETQRLLLLM